MKRNMERSSGSSDEDKTSLKKAKKENSGKLKNAETEIGESIDGSKKRVTNCKVEETLLKVKRVHTENESHQKTVNNKIGCNVNHKSDSSRTGTESRNEDIIKEIKLVSTETFTNGRYKKYPTSCNDTKLENILEENVSNCDQEPTDEGSSRREETMINDQEYILLAEQLTDLFRGIYRDAVAQNEEENNIRKCEIRSKALDSVIKINNARGESYLCNIRTNSNYASNIAEKSDEGLEKEAKNYNSDNEVRNERLNESNNLSFREDVTISKSFRDISSEKCDKIVSEESNSSRNSEMNEGFRKLSSNTYEEYGVESKQTNRNREENNKAIQKTDKFAKCQSNANSHEECSTRGISDEVSSSSTDVKMSDEEGKYSSGDAEYDRRCNELINAEKIKRMKCEVENDTRSYEEGKSELNGGSDMSTDEDSWSDDRKSAQENDFGTEESDNSSEEESCDDSTDEISDEEADSPGTEESDNSSEEDSDDNNTDQSSDEVSSSYGEENSETSSGEDDSTDSESSVGESAGMSTDEDSSNESEYDNNNSELIDENPEEEENTSYGEDIDSERDDTSSLSSGKSVKTEDITDDESSNSACEERNNSTDLVAYYRGARKVNVTSGDVGPSVIYGDGYYLLNYRSKEEIHSSSTEDENCLDCAKDCSSTEIDYMSDAENIKNKRTPESVGEVNDESNSEGSRSYDNTCGLESLFNSVLGFASHRRLSIATLGQDSITISVTRLKLMPFKDSFRKSVDGRHKKRNVANRKGNIITPPVRGNFRGEKTGRNKIPDKVSVKNKATELSDAEQQTSDEEWQVKDSTSKKSRNKKGNKQIEYDSDHKKDSESDEDYEKDENSSEEAGENNGKGHGDDEDEDIGEEDSDEDYEEEADNEFEDDDEVEEEEGEDDDEEYVEVEEQGDSEEEENGDENEEDIEEEEENQEYVDGNVTTQMQNDGSEQSSDNDQWNSLAKSKTTTKKKAAKQARGKTNLVKKKKDRGE